MPYTPKELAEYMERMGVRCAYLAGYDGDGKFHFASTHGEQPELRGIHAAARDYIEGTFDPSLTPRGNHGHPDDDAQRSDRRDPLYLHTRYGTLVRFGIKPDGQDSE